MSQLNLDSKDYQKATDSQNMLGSIIELPLQIEQTWKEVSDMEIPENYSDIDYIVFSGMGGSSLGAYVVKYLFGSLLRVPFEIVNDYTLPAYISERTLVVVQTYSGTTEETLACFDQAVDMKAKIYAISAGGTLETKAKEHGAVYFKVDPRHNPSNQPRMAIGYSIFALMAFLSKLGFIDITDEELKDVIDTLNSNNALFGFDKPTSDNPIKQLAWDLHDRLPIFIAGEHLIGSIHTIRNQVNENAKSLAVYFPLPECDHHLLEGEIFPLSTKDYDFYIFFNSNLYSDKISLRLEATQEIIKDLHHHTHVIDVPGSTKLGQTMAAIHMGSYAGYYLALVNGIDPSPIPQVENFKKRIAHA